jgi:amino acid transporter
MPFKMPELGEHGELRRNAGVVSLLLISITSMIGSGWLFGAYHAAQIAGPLAVWSWVIGAIIIMLIALCFAELSALFPRSGALVHMSSASHGQTLGHIWGWMLWLSYVATPAIEATAVVTYANNYYPHFVIGSGNHTLTTLGLVASGLLVSVFALLNMMAVRALLRINNAITVWKVIVPIVTIFALIWAGRSTGNAWTAAPGTYSVSGIFTALPLAGIVFSLLGFRTAIDLAGETANPGRSLPIAVVGSVVLVAIIYVFLQIAVISALDPADLKNGWASLTFTGSTGPFAGLAATLGLTWLAVILYTDASNPDRGLALAGCPGTRS